MNQSMEIRILEGASALFFKYGFNRVKFSEIARYVGVTTRTIYNYFPNKQSLASAVSRYTIDRMIREVEELFQSRKPFPELLTDLLDMVYEELNTTLPAYKVNAGSPPGGGLVHDFSRIDPAIQQVFLQIFQNAVEEGIIRKDASRDMLIQILLTQVNYCFPLDSARGGAIVDKKYFIESIFLILKGLLTERGARMFQ